MHCFSLKLPRLTSFLPPSPKGHLRIVKTLLTYGASVYAINFRGMTALHEAVLWRRADMVRFLVRTTGPALINRVDNQGRTPLWLAALAGDLRLVELLHDSGALVDQASQASTRNVSRNLPN